jgi:hypothetical protein
MDETLIRGAANGAIQAIRLEQDARKQNKESRKAARIGKFFSCFTALLILLTWQETG